MDTTTKIDAQLRKGTGTKDAKRLRKQGLIPAIIYGHKKDPIACILSREALSLALHQGTRLVDTGLGGPDSTCLIKAVQYDYLGDTLIHADLTRVNLTDRVTVTVPVELRGTPVGVNLGGMLEQVLNNLEIECLVTEIPEALLVRVGDMEIGTTLHVSDITLPEGVTITARPEDAVSVVRALGAEEEEEEEEAAVEGASGEPEVIGKSKEEEADEA